MYNIEEKYIIGTVYGLADMDGNIFYVGSTYSPLNVRLAQHFSDARMSFFRYNNWGPRYKPSAKCQMILDLNYNVKIVVIDKSKYTADCIYDADALFRVKEIDYIIGLRSSGINLTNSKRVKGNWYEWNKDKPATKEPIEINYSSGKPYTIEKIRKQIA